MLKKRVLSAVVLLPIPILAIYFGSPWFELLAATTAVLMAWEWQMMMDDHFSVGGIITAIAGSYTCLLISNDPGIVASAVAVATLLMMIVTFLRRTAHYRLFWVGIPYITLGLGGLVFVNNMAGMATVLWLFCIVWATDSGAYLFGCWLRGPLLMPKISPKKTWAGLIGGMLCAGAVGAAFALCMGLSNWLYPALISLNLAVLAQAGDLFESLIKRRLDLKDSGNLIPGHGGLFDRLDGLLFVAPMVALIVHYAGGGLAAWQ